MDPRLEAARARLWEAQDRYAELVRVYQAARAAYQRSRSKKNRDALLAASAACDASEDVGPLYDAIDAVEALIVAEGRAQAEEEARAREPTFL